MSSAISHATTVILANEGWGCLNANSVSREAGCTVATVRSRASTPEGLAQRAWQELLAQPLHRDLTLVVDGANYLARTHDPAPLVHAWQRLATRTVERDAGTELAVVANTTPVVAAFVDPVVGSIGIPDARHDPLACLRATAALGIGMGLVLTSRHPWAQDAGLRDALEVRAMTLMEVSPTDPLPSDVDEYLTEVEVLAENDPLLNALLRATIRLIGERGADGVTVKEIAEASGATEGLIFSRYPTKLALIGDALHRHSERMWESMSETGRLTGMRYGPAIAGAAYEMQFLDDARASLRAINLEQARVSWHHTPLLVQAIERINAFRRAMADVPGWAHLQTDQDFFLDFVSGTGVMFMQRYVPHANTLPWLSVTTARANELMSRAERTIS